MLNENTKTHALVVGTTNYTMTDITKSINSHFDAVTAIKGFEMLTEVNTKAIALVVKQIKDKEIYIEAGFKTLAEYVNSVFGYSKSHVSGMLKVVNRFLKEGTKTKYSENGNDFTFTQLRALAKFEDTEIDEYIKNGTITFESTVKEIETLADKKNAVAGEVVEETTEPNGATEPNETTETSEKYYSLVEVIINGAFADIGTIETKFSENDIKTKAEKNKITAYTNDKNNIVEFIYDKKTHTTTVNTYKMIEG